MRDPSLAARFGAAACALALVLAGPAAAQHEHSPYAAGQSSQVKSMTQQQVDDLLAGAGMGLALPAELNGHPGPRHVLELADSLVLTSEQRARTQELFDAMQAEAVALGERLLEAEAALNDLFAAGSVEEGQVALAVMRAARLEGELRIVHLRTHVAMYGLLTEHQRHTYDRLRGYGAGHGPVSAAF